MCSDLKCYWLLIAAALLISIPFKVRFMKWWSRRRQEQRQSRHDKWGDEE